MIDEEKSAAVKPGEQLPGHLSDDSHDIGYVDPTQGKLHQNLKGRHMQMIAM